MNKKDIALAALAAADGRILTPVQMQKLLFLIDTKAASLVGGPYFKFQPYDYGPFDQSVYATLESLHREGYVEIMSDPALPYKKYSLAVNGMIKGHELLAQFSEGTQEYLRTLAAWVTSLSFKQLVSAIYTEFPEMKANSIFAG